jgi:hypothetical protein
MSNRTCYGTPPAYLRSAHQTLCGRVSLFPACTGGHKLNKTIGIYKTALLAAYSNTDRRVRPFVIFVKYWSKMRKVADTRQGGLGSFAWCLLCIYFLMKVADPPVVPNLQAIARERKYCQGYDVGFSKEVVMSNNWSSNGKVCILHELRKIPLISCLSRR